MRYFELIDYNFMGICTLMLLGAGFWLQRRASKSLDNFICGGGRIPWRVSQVLALGAACSLQAAEAPKNVLFITVDDMSYRTPGVCGGPIAGLTPNMDRLAGEGMRFERAFVTVGVCTPSRHVWLTGQHSHTTHTGGFVPIPKGTVNLVSELQRHGYFCALMNKNPQGYSLDDYVNDGVALGRDPQRYHDQLSEWLQKNSGQPFFIQMNIMDPHRPFVNSPMEWVLPGFTTQRKNFKQPDFHLEPLSSMPENFLPDLPGAREDLWRYYLSVARADESVGKILQALEESGRAGDTLVVFSSDHGMAMPFSKANAWEESLHVPLFVRWPGRVAPGSVNAQHWFSSVDVAPTLLDCLGFDVPEAMQGHSAKDALLGKAVHQADGVWGYFYQATSPYRYPIFSWISDDFVYVFNVWHRPGETPQNNKVDGRYPGRSDMTIGSAWQSMVESPDGDVQRLTQHHRYRCREELYRRGEPAHPDKNLINEPEYQPVRVAMKQQMLVAMRAETHPLADLVDRADAAELAAYMNTLRAEETASRYRYPRLPEDTKRLRWQVGQEDQIRLIEVKDGQFSIERDGVKSVVLCPPQPMQRVNYLYFQVHDAFTQRVGAGSYFVELRLRTDEPVPLRIQFKGRVAQLSVTPVQQIPAAEEFAAYRFVLNDPLFENSLPKGAEFRLAVPAGKRIELESLEFGTLEETK